MLHDLVLVGGTLKSLGENRVGGILVPFGSPKRKDRQGEYFHVGTDFYTLDGTRPVIYHHGFHPSFGKKSIGVGRLSMTDEGIAIEAELNLPPVALKSIMLDAQSGKLGWSSGSAAHMVEKGEDGSINRWFIAEASITYSPVSPDARLVPVKALGEFDKNGEYRNDLAVTSDVDTQAIRLRLELAELGELV